MDHIKNFNESFSQDESEEVLEFFDGMDDVGFMSEIKYSREVICIKFSLPNKMQKFGYKIPIGKSLGMCFQFVDRMENMTDWRLNGITILFLDGESFKYESFNLKNFQDRNKLIQFIMDYPYAGFFEISVGK